MRSSALKLLIRILNLRANYRMTMCIDTFEKVLPRKAL